jgi:hypothetical protein
LTKLDFFLLFLLFPRPGKPFYSHPSLKIIAYAVELMLIKNVCIFCAGIYGNEPADRQASWSYDL